jgi:hypothetical protein
LVVSPPFRADGVCIGLVTQCKWAEVCSPLFAIDKLEASFCPPAQGERSTWEAQLSAIGRWSDLNFVGHEPMEACGKQQATKKEWDVIADIIFHDLRHDFAHRAREAGWTLEEVAYYLGHLTKLCTPAIQTTVRYTQVSRSQVRERLRLLYT